MSSIYLKVTIEKNRRSQSFDFLTLKNSSPGQFLGSSNSHRSHYISKLLVETEGSDVKEQNGLWLFYYFYFKRNYGV